MEGIISTYPILVGSVVGTVLSVLMNNAKGYHTQILGGIFNPDVDPAIFNVKKYSNDKYYYEINSIYQVIIYSFIACYSFIDVIKHVITHFLLKNNSTIFTYTLTSHIICYFIHNTLLEGDNKFINFENLTLHLLYATCYVLGGKSLWIPVLAESIQTIGLISLLIKNETDRIKSIIFKRDDIPSEITEEDYNRIFISN